MDFMGLPEASELSRRSAKPLNGESKPLQQEPPLALFIRAIREICGSSAEWRRIKLSIPKKSPSA
jgi:hypothetical protein